MDILKVILTALWSAASLFLIAKFMGHKQVSQLNFFDYVTGITIGSIAAELATELESPMKPFVAMIIYGLVSIALSLIMNKVPRMRKYINGTPTILFDAGKLYRKNLKKSKMDLSEFMVLCRTAGYFNLEQIQTAVFEHNGKLSILPVSSKRPATPEDIGVKVQPELISVEVIMDGRVLGENLRRMGKDIEWLEKEIGAKGFSSAREIFLATVDNNGVLKAYAVE